MEIHQGGVNSFSKELKNILGEKKMYLIVDENTSQYVDYLEKSLSISPTYLELENGEKNKNFNSVLKVWNFLNHNNLKTNDILFILGGGMLTDLAGFAASTYKRGIEFVFLPTKCLAVFKVICCKKRF